MGNLLWLASYPKSGNTWIRAFLANLIANRLAPLPLAELPRYCEDESRAQLYRELSGRPAEELDIDTICALRPQVQATLAARAEGTLLVKTHNFWGGFGESLLHNPQVTVGGIYVVRNPLDVVVSMSHHFGLDIDGAIDFLGNEDTATDTDSRWVSQILGSWSTHVQSWSDIEHPRFVVVRYEDLLEKPAKTFARVARVVGVEDRARIERAVAHASFATLSKIERRDGFIEASEKTDARFFRVGRSNQWRQQLTREQVARVVDGHGAMMRRYRYLPAGAAGSR